MFRLIKLAFYALVGYALYELYQGYSATQPGGQSGGRGKRDLNKAHSSKRGRMQTLTGEGKGHKETTLDDSGASATHSVGRGVTTT
jgi:hypothetical protein